MSNPITRSTVKPTQSQQGQGLAHASLIEVEVVKLPEIAGIAPRDISHVGVIGGGTMGAGIAVSALLNGLRITLIEQNTAAAEKAHATVAHILEGSVKRGKLDEARRDALLAHDFVVSTDYAELAKVDLVIEAVFESLDVKKQVFTQLDAICREGAILATNTSYLDINVIAAMTSRPQDVIGLHFFSPAHIMKLLEVVVGDKTAPDVLATGFALAKTLRKTPVRAGVCDGFIGNRILAVNRAVAEHMVLDGASPAQVDRALVEFGFAMGPFSVSDLAGLDIAWANRKRKAATRNSRERAVGFTDAMCEQGWFGQKVGRGYYLYDKDTPRGTPNPDVAILIERDRKQRGITPREFSDEDIVRRYLCAMINEAAKVVGEGIASRPLDVDVTMLNGYGSPRYRGGPMNYADTVGLDVILADINTFAKEDPHFWQAAPLLSDLVERGESFSSLNNITKN